MDAPLETRIDELLAGMQRLTDENERMRARLETLEAADGGVIDSALPKDRPVSRRGLLRRTGSIVAAAAAAATVGALAGPATAAAGGNQGQALELGSDTNTATEPTRIAATQNSGNGVVGLAVTDAGFSSFQGSGAIAGHTNGSYSSAVLGYAESSASIGVTGFVPGIYGLGVHGYGGLVGVHGDTAGDIGVRGTAASGRGGEFTGGKAQIRLKPSGAATHPAVGARGDLFVDATGRLWYCKKGGAGSVWILLA